MTSCRQQRPQFRETGLSRCHDYFAFAIDNRQHRGPGSLQRHQVDIAACHLGGLGHGMECLTGRQPFQRDVDFRIRAGSPARHRTEHTTRARRTPAEDIGEPAAQWP